MGAYQLDLSVLDSDIDGLGLGYVAVPWQGELDGATVGLVAPDEKLCTGCHNEESPTFEGFDYEKMLKKIAHPIPEEKKATYKAAGTK